MKPSEVSNTLKRIASKIDNSENPKRALVAKDLRRVIVAIDAKQKKVIKRLFEINDGMPSDTHELANLLYSLPVALIREASPGHAQSVNIIGDLSNESILVVDLWDGMD